MGAAKVAVYCGQARKLKAVDSAELLDADEDWLKAKMLHYQKQENGLAKFRAFVNGPEVHARIPLRGLRALL